LLDRQQPRQTPSRDERLKKGQFEETIGRSRGGRTRKIHALADDRSRPLAFALTLRKLRGRCHSLPLLGAVGKLERLLADKAYDADRLRRWLKQKRSERSFPPHRLQAHAPPDRAAYQRRTSSNACSGSRRIGDAAQPDTTASLETISPASSRPSNHRMDLNGGPLSKEHGPPLTPKLLGSPRRHKYDGTAPVNEFPLIFLLSY
jgi:transposase